MRTKMWTIGTLASILIIGLGVTQTPGCAVSEETVAVETVEPVAESEHSQKAGVAEVAILAAAELAEIMTGKGECKDSLSAAMTVMANLMPKLATACTGMGGVSPAALTRLLELNALLAKYQLEYNALGIASTICDLVSISNGDVATIATRLSWKVLAVIDEIRALLSSQQALCASPPTQLELCDCDIWCQPNTLPPSDVTKKRRLTILTLPSATPPASCSAWAPSQCPIGEYVNSKCTYSHALGPTYTANDLAEIVRGITAGQQVCLDRGTFDRAGVCNGNAIGGGGQSQCWAACGLTPGQYIDEGIDNACNKQCYETVGEACRTGTCDSSIR